MRPAMNDFVLKRTFNAPRNAVWNAWTDSQRLLHWWGPKGFKTVSCKLDLRPGGTFLYGLQTPDGKELWGRWAIRDVVKPEKLDFIVSFSNPEGGVTRNPWNADWPLQTRSTVSFEESRDQTSLTVRWSPYEATDVEQKSFDDGHASMQQGWTGTLDQLEAYLARGSSPEQRSEDRIQVRCSGTLALGENKAPCEIQNMCSRGFLIRADKSLPIGHVLELCCDFDSARSICCKVQVRHVNRQCLGAKVIEISEEELAICRQYIAERRAANTTTES